MSRAEAAIQGVARSLEATFLTTSFDWSQCIFLLQGDRSPLKGISAEARSMNHPTMTSLYFLSHSSQAGSVWEINGNCSKHLQAFKNYTPI
jgi:hypothetical protein